MTDRCSLDQARTQITSRCPDTEMNLFCTMIELIHTLVGASNATQEIQFHLTFGSVHHRKEPVAKFLVMLGQRGTAAGYQKVASAGLDALFKWLYQTTGP